MKRLKWFLVIWLIVLVFAAIGSETVHATNITTETTTTEEQTTTTEEAVVEEEPIVYDDIEIGEDYIKIGDTYLSRENAVPLLAGLIEAEFGEYLKPLGISASVVAASLIGLGAFGLWQLKKHRLVMSRIGDQNAEIAKGQNVKNEVEKDVLRAQSKSDAKLKKVEAQQAVITELLMMIVSNSNNANISKNAVKYKKIVADVLEMSDKIDESVVDKIIDSAKKQVVNMAVGKGAEEAKKHYNRLIATLKDEDQDETSEG